MPNDYSAAGLPDLIVNFDELFKGTRQQLEMFEAPMAAAALMERQTAGLIPIYKGMDYRCTGFSVVYQQADQSTIGNGTATPAAAECVITPTDTFSGLKADYDIDRFFEKKISVLGKDCDSAIKFATRLSGAMAVKMQQLALDINQWLIAVLVANKQTATNTGDYGTGIVGGIVQYNKADLLDATKWQQILSDWYFLGMEELLPASLFGINGRNFAIQSRDSQFNAANDNQRSQALALGAMPMFWDIHGFGATRANILDNSFLIDPNAYVVITRNQFSETPEQMGDSNNETRFALPLRYLDAMGNTQTMMYNLNGTMAPIMVDCRLQYVCDPTNAVDGAPSFNYVMHMSVKLDMKLAPNQSSKTGIVQIEAV